ncbi:MAG: SPFH domain-containing protein [Deltaproteobacteria bacterium]|nr:SPFH domain-containing protein [Deltaproteobacteria bacterium]
MAILDLIEWATQSADDLVFRFVPPQATGIRLGAQLVVREAQAAVFMRDGQALDLFGPGRHTLSTLNLPLVGRLLGKVFGGATPFHTEVVFISTRLVTDVKWGTRSPVPMRDAELGLVRVRAFGSSSLRVADPGLFVNTVVAQRSRFTTADIVEFLKDAIIARLADVLGENMKSIFDLASLYDEISAAAKVRTKVDFEKLGLELVDFYINAVTPPEEVQKKIDERAGMAALGDMNRYTQYKAAEALGAAASNPGGGGLAGAGVALALGVEMAKSLSGAINPPVAAPAQAAPASGPTVACPACQAPSPAGANFCAQCGAKIPKSAFCTQCGAAIPAGAKFCPGCGQKTA